MSKAGNTNWGKPDQPAVVIITEFERKVVELKLEPDQYIGSGELRMWAAFHQGTRYVPEALLKAWRIGSE